MWQFFVLVLGLLSCPSPGSAFWWPKPTTETPRSQVLQQIPLTYFRTYTYQPLAGEAFGMPLFGFGAAQTPLLTGRHYDPYAVTSYAAARRHDAVARGDYKADVTPPAMGSPSAVSTTAAAAPAPTTTTTSTTTTTTTPPPPPPPPTTTTTTTTTTTSAPPTSSSTETSAPVRYSPYGGEYPAYTRRFNNLYTGRPQYPYPDYFNYQPQAGMSEKSGGSSRIQFVPCMCPVSMPSMPSMATISSLSSLSTPSTSTDRDRPTGVTIASGPVMATSIDPGNMVALQARHIESEEEAVDEETDASSAEDDDADTALDSKPNLSEPQSTTPLVESISLA